MLSSYYLDAINLIVKHWGLNEDEFSTRFKNERFVLLMVNTYPEKYVYLTIEENFGEAIGHAIVERQDLRNHKIEYKQLLDFEVYVALVSPKADYDERNFFNKRLKNAQKFVSRKYVDGVLGIEVDNEVVHEVKPFDDEEYPEWVENSTLQREIIHFINILPHVTIGEYGIVYQELADGTKHSLIENNTPIKRLSREYQYVLLDLLKIEYKRLKEKSSFELSERKHIVFVNTDVKDGRVFFLGNSGFYGGYNVFLFTSERNRDGTLFGKFTLELDNVSGEEVDSYLKEANVKRVPELDEKMLALYNTCGTDEKLLIEVLEYLDEHCPNG